MKRVIIIIFFLGLLAMSASAQKFRRGRFYSYPRTSIVIGAYPFYGPFSPYRYNPYGYRFFPRESKLEMRLEEIRQDYKDKIRSARHDTSLSHSQRRKVIRNLKDNRRRELADERASYYRRRY